LILDRIRGVIRITPDRIARGRFTIDSLSMEALSGGIRLHSFATELELLIHVLIHVLISHASCSHPCSQPYCWIGACYCWTGWSKRLSVANF
jgi:hypothetical protein